MTHTNLNSLLRTPSDAVDGAATTNAGVVPSLPPIDAIMAQLSDRAKTFVSRECVVAVTQAMISAELRSAGQEDAALVDDARECLMDVISHHHDFRTACIEVKASNETTRSDELYWQKQIVVLDRMKGQAERALAARSGDDAAQTQAARDVLAERQRQVTAEGWAPERDDSYRNNELPRAAAAYILGVVSKMYDRGLWPWNKKWWKPTTPRRDLVKAGALILAEIERIDRAASSTGNQS